MCGITGQLRSDGAGVDPGLIEDMCAGLEHRGPDSRGVFAEGPVGLGIQRLRIIDLDTGDQPIFNEDRSVVVVLNGEIYNYRELRERLIRSGHRFATQSDTEVLVHLYEEEGVDCVRSLQGMFAFALWDSRRRQLLLARDRVGKKPLFYSERAGAISFASELRALMADGEIPRELDHRALDCYYAYQYIPAPMSVFRAVRKLPPASTMVVRDGQTTIQRYWELDFGNKQPDRPREEVEEELRDRLRLAVGRRMVADVPLGAFLSGGVDSSAIVALMAEQSDRPVKTFSIGFEDDSFNELPYARLIAERFATEHHEFVVKPSALEILPKIVRHYGEPFADSSAVPSFYVAELTRRHVTVALNGDGGDESFGGYNRYLSNLLAGRLEWLPLPARRAIAAVAGRLPSGPNMRSPLNRAKRLGRSLALDEASRYARHMSYFDWLAREQLYTPEYADAIGRSAAPEVIAGPWKAASGQTRLDTMLEVDIETYLPGDLLVKMDIATMAHSLEARSPFLDPDVMEFAATLPPSMKIRGMEKKVVLRDALRPMLPAEVLDRPKMGFGVPIARWFREELSEFVRDVLLDEATLGRGYFQPEYVRGLIRRHQAGEEDCSPKLWALLVAELWHREFVDHSPAHRLSPCSRAQRPSRRS
jgi:asparagine synthase (glutamine-hydrolysing)